MRRNVLTGALVLAVVLVAALPVQAKPKGAVPAEIRFTRSVIEAPASAALASFTAQLYDAAGNPVKKRGVIVQFSVNSPDAAVDPMSTRTNRYGQAAVTVTAPPYIGEYQVTAASAGLIPATATLRVRSTVAMSVAIDLRVNGDPFKTVAPGTTVEVRVRIKDSYGTSLSDQAYGLVPAVADPWLTLAPGTATNTAPWTWNPTDGYYSTTITAGATSTTIQVTDNLPQNPVSASRTLQVGAP